jgi:hypothetical protein
MDRKKKKLAREKKLTRENMKNKPKKKVASVSSNNGKQLFARASRGPPNYDAMGVGDSTHASQLHDLLLPYFRTVALIAKGHQNNSFAKESVIDCTVLPDDGVLFTHTSKAKRAVLSRLHFLVLTAVGKYQQHKSDVRSELSELDRIWVGCKSAHNRSYLVFLLAIQKIVKDSGDVVGAFSYSDARHFAGVYGFVRNIQALKKPKELATEPRHREFWGIFVEWGVLEMYVNQNATGR